MTTTSKWKRYSEHARANAEWFGSLPQHWQAMRVRHLFRVFNGATPKSSEPEYWDGDITWVTPDDLQGGSVRTLRSSARLISSDGYASCGTTLTPPGSLILSTRAPIGYVALTDIDTCTNQGCRTLVGGRLVHPPYYFYALIAARRELISRSNGTTFLEISTQKLKDVPLPVPPMEEQRTIASFLDRESAGVSELVRGVNDASIDGETANDGLVSRLYRALCDYRDELILNAVSGNIDVRGTV